MSFEQPSKVDLQNTEDTQQLLQGLTLREKNSLKESFSEEKNQILYMTQEETNQLKRIIEAGNNHDTDREERVLTFIQGQIQEGLSSSDVLSSIEVNQLSPEILDHLDACAFKVLFEQGGPFANVELSDTAKDNMSVSLTIALIEDIKNNPQSLVEMMTKIQSPDASAEDIFGKYSEGLSQMSAAMYTSASETLEPDIHIRENGEKNELFMNPLEGKNFLLQVFNGEIPDIRSHIESRNSEEIIVPENALQLLMESGKLTQADIDTILAALPQPAEGGPDDNPDAPPADPTDPENSDEAPFEALKKMGFLGEMIAAFLEALQGLVPVPEETDPEATDTTGGPEQGPVDAETVTSTPAQKAREFFTQNQEAGIFTGMNKESIIALFPESGELSPVASRILEQIQQLPGDEPLEEKMTDIFLQEVPREEGSSEQTPKLLRFISDMNTGLDTNTSLQNPDGTIHAQNFLTTITGYINYRQRNEQWKNSSENTTPGSNMTYKAFFAGAGAIEEE